jgi:hypothetical protein
MRFASPISYRPFSGVNGLQGLPATLLGYGMTGTRVASGWSIQDGTQGTRRWARNAIDLFLAGVQIETSPGVFRTSDCIWFDLDDPLGINQTNILGGAAIADEGGIASWDSGGGWFVLENGRERLVGTSAYVGTFDGTGVQQWNHFGGVGGAVHLNSYQAWIGANVPDLGRAILESLNMELGGTVVSGTIANLYDSDNVRMSLQSADLSAFELNELFGFRVVATTTASPANTMDILLEGKVNSQQAACSVLLRNWTSGQFETVHTYIMGIVEATETKTNIPAANYVRSDGRIEMRFRVLAFSDDIVFIRADFDRIRFDAR